MIGIFLTILHVGVCSMLILVILLQAGRGQGLTGPAFGGGNVQSLFGTRAADFLTKATSVTAICFLLTSLSLDYLETVKSRSLLEVGRRTTSLDIETIRKALEKVKSDEAAASSVATQLSFEVTSEGAAPIDEILKPADFGVPAEIPISADEETVKKSIPPEAFEEP